LSIAPFGRQILTIWSSVSLPYTQCATQSAIMLTTSYSWKTPCASILKTTTAWWLYWWLKATSRTTLSSTAFSWTRRIAWTSRPCYTTWLGSLVYSAASTRAMVSHQ
jgi:hypothetical protein